jgi:soluble lytic murein transglycosylase
MQLARNVNAIMARIRSSLIPLVLALTFAGAGLAVPPCGAEAAVKAVPAPELQPAEKAQKHKLAAALSPLLSIDPSPSDLKALREAAAAVRAKSLDDFASAKSGISDPVARKLADWMRLRAGLGQPPEFQAFLRDNPSWPDRSTITEGFETALFRTGGDPKTIRSYFATTKPETGPGYAALASADLAEGDREEARRLASKAWREMSIPPELENGFLDRFSDLLTPADHKWRFDRTVTDDVRYAGNRKARVALAKRLIPLLPANQQRSAAARLAVFNKAANAGDLMGDVAGHGGDAGLAFHRIQLLRKAGKIEEAADIILSFPPDPKKLASLDEWWAERRELAYGALKNDNPALAYKLVRDAGPLSVNPLKEQTFLAGWIAFRFLNKPGPAEKHFAAMSAAADGPLSRAKAAYWLGRVKAARGDKAGAAEQYRLAAANPDTFHGLLAMQTLADGRSNLQTTPPANATAAQLRKITTSEVARALIFAKKANLSREVTRTFLAGLRNAAPTEAEVGVVAYLAEEIGDPQMSLRIAKIAIGKGQNLLTYGYPLSSFPGYTPLRSPPELPLLLGLARQETEFDTQTVSGAGAKGLLQVMPATARHVCNDYKIKCQLPRLLSDPSYNAMIGSAYIADRMDDFGGSYVLGLAGYNAGPGRARQWMREFGDPRDPGVDPIDWIERIPITETRDYVTKVLANIQIYRARLGVKNPLRLQQDIARSRADRRVPSSPDPRDGVATNSDG